MFTCVSNQGNPPPEMKWLRKTEGSSQWEELSGGITTPSADKFGSTQSVLNRKIERRDHKSQFQCSAENEASLAPSTKTIIMDVRYAPIVKIRPSDHTGNNLVVISESNVTLTCDVDSNPATSSIIWTKDGAQITAPDFRSVAKEDTGNYSCLATNEIRSARAWMALDVEYGPRVRVVSHHVVNNSLTVPEGTRVNLTCLVDANPIVNTIQWMDGTDTVVKWGAVYVIDNVLRNKAGRLTCMAENILHPTVGPQQQKKGSQDVRLVVQYPPGKANITGPRYVLKGEEAVLICHLADWGVPEAAIEWTRLGDPSNTIISRQAELRFPSAQLINNADYICKPTNTINDGGPDTFRLVVNERPEMTAGGELAERLTVNMTQLSPLSVQCQARGRPLPQVRWYKDERPIGDHDGLFMVEVEHVAIDIHSYLVSTTLLWKGPSRDRLDRLERHDTGNYRCDFINEHGNTHSAMDLTIQYMPILNVTADRVATDMNQSAALSCSAQAVPQPQFKWYYGDTRLLNSGRVTITTDVMNGPFPYTSTLNISDVTTEDLGGYRCVGFNSLGFAERHIFLTVKTTPDAPSNLMVRSKTWESVELMWEAGFDGGYPQVFYIFYTSAHQNNTRLRVAPNSNSKFNVTGLFPSTTYMFKVFGENQLGGGQYSYNVTTITAGHPIEPPIEVFYHLQTRTLNFISPSTNYCVRIEVFDNLKWNVYEECAPSTGSVKIRDGVPAYDVRIALCLQRRQAICSATTKAFLVKPPQDDLSVETIIAVACVCGAVVLTLLIILIVLCVRRYQAKKEYENDLNTPRPPPNKKMNGIDNPSMDQTDMVDMDPSSRQRRQNNANYNIGYDSKSDGQQHQQQQHHQQQQQQGNGYMNGGPNWGPRPNGNIPVEPPPDYREVEHENRGRPESEYIAMHNKGRKRQKSDGPEGHDSGYIPDHVKEGSDSGLSTPDPTKPKKVFAFKTGGLPLSPQLQGPNINPIYNISGSLVNYNNYSSANLDPSSDNCQRIESNSAHEQGLMYGFTSPWVGVPRAGQYAGRDIPQQRPMSLCEPLVAPPIVNDQSLGAPMQPPPMYQPQLRVADGDSPYGFHGAPAADKNKKTPIKIPHWTESEMRENYIITSPSWRKPASTSVSPREPDGRHTDFIRGTIHDSMRIGHNRPTGDFVDQAQLFRLGNAGMDRSTQNSNDRPTSNQPQMHGFNVSGLHAGQKLAIPQGQPMPNPAQLHLEFNSSQVWDNKIPSILDNYSTAVKLDTKKNPPDVLPKPKPKPKPKSVPPKNLRKTEQASKPKGRTKFSIKNTKAQIPTDPRDVIAALLKEQKAEVSDSSDEDNTAHNIKPSAMKKMMRKKRDRSSIPKQPRRPPSSVFTNSDPNKPSAEASPKNNKVSILKNRPLPGKMVVAKVLAAEARQTISQCSVCNADLTVHPSDFYEAVTDFTTPKIGSTVYNMKNLICNKCKNFSLRECPQIELSSSPTMSPPQNQPTQPQKYHQLPPQGNNNNSLQVLTFQGADPPYESDTDSPNPDLKEKQPQHGQFNATTYYTYGGPAVNEGFTLGDEDPPIVEYFHPNSAPPSITHDLYEHQSNVAIYGSYKGEGTYGSQYNANISHHIYDRPGMEDVIQNADSGYPYAVVPIANSTPKHSKPSHQRIQQFRHGLQTQNNQYHNQVDAFDDFSGAPYTERDITKHYVPPPPVNPPPSVPSSGSDYYNSGSSSHYSNEVNASTIPLDGPYDWSGMGQLSSPVPKFDSYQRHRPPTPPSVKLIPHRKKSVGKKNNSTSNSVGFNGRISSAGNYFVFPEPRHDVSHSSTSGASDQPQSSVSTIPTSHEEIISSSTSHGSDWKF